MEKLASEGISAGLMSGNYYCNYYNYNNYNYCYYY